MAHKLDFLDFCTKNKSLCSKFKWFKLQNSSYSYIAIKKIQLWGFLARVLSKVIMWHPVVEFDPHGSANTFCYPLHHKSSQFHPSKSSFNSQDKNFIHLYQASIYIIKIFIHVFDGITVIYIYILNWVSFIHSFTWSCVFNVKFMTILLSISDYHPHGSCDFLNVINRWPFYDDHFITLSIFIHVMTHYSLSHPCFCFVLFCCPPLIHSLIHSCIELIISSSLKWVGCSCFLSEGWWNTHMQRRIPHD